MAERWPKHHGMLLGGIAQNFHGEFAVNSDFLKKVVAAFVVETFTGCIAFKGHTPLIATLAHSRCAVADLHPGARVTRESIH